MLYRVSIKSLLDYRHVLQENSWNRNIYKRIHTIKTRHKILGSNLSNGKKNMKSEGSSSGIWLNIERSLLPTRLLILMHAKRTYHNCTHNRLTEDKPSGLKHVEDIKIKN